LPPRNWQLRVEDILDAANRIESYIAGIDFDRFQADRKTVDAVVRNLQIIGEAATHLAKVEGELPPDIPWADISGMRNILIHEYFGVDVAIVWQTVSVDLPLLRATLLARRQPG
jgi:uncharacterized protein with HEPN domain